jgi:hypothetical protein
LSTGECIIRFHPKAVFNPSPVSGVVDIAGTNTQVKPLTINLQMPVVPKSMLVSTEAVSNLVVISQNNGDSWTNFFNNNPRIALAAVTTIAANGDRLVAGNLEGNLFYRDRDASSRWVRATIAPDPARPTTPVRWVAGNDKVWVATFRQSNFILVSRDQGVTWQRLVNRPTDDSGEGHVSAVWSKAFKKWILLSGSGGVRINNSEDLSGPWQPVHQLSPRPNLGLHMISCNDHPKAGDAICVIGGAARTPDDNHTTMWSTDDLTKEWKSYAIEFTAPDFPLGAPLIMSVTYGADKWIAVGETGAVISSNGSLTAPWRTSYVSDNRIDSLFSITWNNAVFMAVGGRGSMYSSVDGVTWIPRSTGIGNPGALTTVLAY